MTIIFNKKRMIALALGMVASASALAAQPALQWNVPVAASANALQKNISVKGPLVNTSRDPVAFTYAIDSAQALDFTAPVHTEKSRQYWLDTTGEKLAAGVSLPVTGGDTVIRISPLDVNKAGSLSAGQVALLAEGKTMPLDVFADAESLQKTGVPFTENTVAFKSRLPEGRATLKVTGLRPDMPVVVHVFEPESTQVLELSTVKTTFGANEPVQVVAALRDGGNPQAANWQGYISLPDGRLAGELKFSPMADGRYQAVLPVSELTGLANGLWQVHVFASNDKVMRDAQTAFAVNMPVAAFNGALSWSQNKAGQPQVNVGVDVAVEGRFEVRGVLFAHDANAQLKPFAVTMSAAWLPAGKHAVALPIDRGLLADSGLKPPVEIRQVKLLDQSRLVPVQTVTEGITLMVVPDAADFSQADLSRQ